MNQLQFKQFLFKARHAYSGFFRVMANFFSSLQWLIRLIPQSVLFLGRAVLTFLVALIIIGVIGYRIGEPAVSEGLPITSRIYWNYAIIFIDCPVLMYGQIMCNMSISIEHSVYESFLWYCHNFYHRLALVFVAYLVILAFIVYIFKGLSYYRNHGSKWDQMVASALQITFVCLLVPSAVLVGIKIFSSYMDIGYYWTVLKICAYWAGWALEFLKSTEVTLINWPLAPLMVGNPAAELSIDSIKIELTQTQKAVLAEMMRQLAEQHPNTEQLKKMEILAVTLAEAIRML